MNNGLYTAFLGMRSRQRTLEAQANNIANASTTGFKAERLIYSLVEAQKKGSEGRQDLVAGVLTSSGTDFTQGTTRETGRALDVSIEGDAFLQIQTPRGVRFTRAGNLTVDSAGQLVTKTGDMVVGQRGPITIPKDSQLSIGEDGNLSANGETFDKIKLARFENPTTALQKEGDALFMLTGEEQPQENTKSRVVQGTLESSNINSVTEMVAMISNNREFESLQRSLSLIMNDVGRKISSDLGSI
jgi:flagellar basal-body rod protein FlgF